MTIAWTGNDYKNGWCSLHVIGMPAREHPKDLELGTWTEDDALAGRCLRREVGNERPPVVPRAKPLEPEASDPLGDVLDVALKLFYENPGQFIAEHPSVYNRLLAAELETKSQARRTLASYAPAELELLSSAELQRLVLEHSTTCPACGHVRPTEIAWPESDK